MSRNYWANHQPHIYAAAPELGPGVCGKCPLKENNAIHVPEPPALPDRYEIDRDDP